MTLQSHDDPTNNTVEKRELGSRGISIAVESSILPTLAAEAKNPTNLRNNPQSLPATEGQWPRTAHDPLVTYEDGIAQSP